MQKIFWSDASTTLLRRVHDAFTTLSHICNATIRYNHGSRRLSRHAYTHLIAELAITHGLAMVLLYTRKCACSRGPFGAPLNHFFNRQHYSKTCSTYFHKDMFKCASHKTDVRANVQTHVSHTQMTFATTWFETIHGRTRALPTCLLTELPLGQFSLRDLWTSLFNEHSWITW